MKRQARTFTVAMAAALLPLMAQGASSKSAPVGAPEESPAQDQRIYCMEGWERLLPGDYYACRALYHLQRENSSQTMEMLREAAYWANKDAQHALGLAYINGDIAGVTPDRPLGIAWLALASERLDPDYVRDYSAAVLASTPSDISSASATYEALRKTYSDRVAGPRATRRFIREVKPLDDAASMGGNFAYIRGLTPFPQGAFALSRKIHKQAEEDFEGLRGTVTVGILERVAAPSPALRERYEKPPPAAKPE